MKDKWVQIVGKSADDSGFQDILNKLGIELNEKSAENCFISKDGATFDYLSLGLSFYLIDGKLDSVDFYSISPKFSTVKPDLIPMGVRLEDTGKDLIMKFGEPLEKGGGMNAKMDIWLRWDHLQVEINEKNWDSAASARWSSLTIF